MKNVAVQIKRVTMEENTFTAVKDTSRTEIKRNTKENQKLLPIMCSYCHFSTSSLGFLSIMIAHIPKSMPEAVKIPFMYSGSTLKSLSLLTFENGESYNP
jgi:hypothetical protein